MQPTRERPIHLGGGLIRFPRDYSAEREAAHDRIAALEIEIAQQRVRLAQIDRDERAVHHVG